MKKQVNQTMRETIVYIISAIILLIISICIWEKMPKNPKLINCDDVKGICVSK